MGDKRTPVTSDVGSYLKALRVENGITAAEVARQLDLSDKTVSNIENGYNPPPNPKRLKLWLSVIGQLDRYKEALAFISAAKAGRQVRYLTRNPANEHIDRLLDAYESDKLTDADIFLLRMIAPEAYT